VLDDPRQDIRVKLVATYADTLKKGLQLLNIAAPDKM
jgi:arginyl-tRNA synthetase